MKSRQRFFDATVLKKDITRFAPAWALYMVGGVLIALSVMAQVYDASGPQSAIRVLNECVGGFALINIVYGMVVAQLLFGDLFKGRLCNGLHAMPVTREGWFFTHLAAGLLFSLLPNLVISLVTLPYVAPYFQASFLWLLGMQLHYLFFFGLGVFSIFCTGNRFASILVYCVINFLSLLVQWFLTTMFIPMLYGVPEIESEILIQLSPVVNLLIEQDYFSVIHLDNCPCLHYKWDSLCQTAWGGLGKSWTYLWLVAATGPVWLRLSLLMYRKRDLERAGDFAVFSWMKPVFWVLFALCAGGAAQMIATEMIGMSSGLGYIFLVVGLVLGFLVSKMLLERTVKVFRLRNFLQLGLLLACFGLALLLTWADFLGISRYVPEANQVKSVCFMSGRMLISNQKDLEGWGNNYGVLVSQDTTVIQEVTQVHQQMIQAGESHYDWNYFTVCYQMKNGRIVTRYYRVNVNTDEGKAAFGLLADPKVVLGYDSLEALQENVSNIVVNGGRTLSDAAAQELLEAIWKDVLEGNGVRNARFHDAYHGENYEAKYYLEANCNSTRGYWYMDVYPCCKNALQWLEKNGVAFGDEGKEA